MSSISPLLEEANLSPAALSPANQPSNSFPGTHRGPRGPSHYRVLLPGQASISLASTVLYADA